jgi:hypothetical protein
VAKNLLENRREKSSVSSLFRPFRYDGQILRFWPDRYVLFLQIMARSLCPILTRISPQPDQGSSYEISHLNRIKDEYPFFIIEIAGEPRNP